MHFKYCILCGLNNKTKNIVYYELNSKKIKKIVSIDGILEKH